MTHSSITVNSKEGLYDLKGSYMGDFAETCTFEYFMTLPKDHSEDIDKLWKKDGVAYHNTLSFNYSDEDINFSFTIPLKKESTYNG